jgi:hypothetical protein
LHLGRSWLELILLHARPDLDDATFNFLLFSSSILLLTCFLHTSCYPLQQCRAFPYGYFRSSIEKKTFSRCTMLVVQQLGPETEMIVSFVLPHTLFSTLQVPNMPHTCNVMSSSFSFISTHNAHDFHSSCLCLTSHSPMPM